MGSGGEDFFRELTQQAQICLRKACHHSWPVTYKQETFSLPLFAAVGVA